MVDPATGRLKAVKVSNAAASTRSKAFDHGWLSGRPCPQRIGCNGGGECKNVFKEMANDCGLAKAQTAAHKPQSNETVERAHLVLADVLKMHELEEQELDPQETFDKMLASAAFAMRSTHHTAPEAAPANLVFGRDMLPPIEMEANWEAMRQRCQEVTASTGARANSSRILRICKAGGKVACNKHGTLCKLSAPRTGPRKARQVCNGGALRTQGRAVSEQIDIRRSTPCVED